MNPSAALELARDPVPSVTTDRQLAIACAVVIVPRPELPDAYDGADIVRKAERFEDWLAGAEDADVVHRRFALAIASEHMTESDADPRRVIEVAGQLLVYLRRR